MFSKKGFLLMMVVLFSFAFSSMAFGADKDSVKINYQKKSKDYTNMVVWAWDGGKESPNPWPNGYEKKGTNSFGIYYEVPLVIAAKKVGFLLVNKSNEQKDGDGDRFIDLTKGKEVWIVEGDSTVYYSMPKTKK